MKKVLCFLFLINIFSVQAYLYELSICNLFKNEGPYLKEWIEYHRLLGVEHFYLYNDHSEDNYYEILQPYLDAGIVELTQIQDGLTYNQSQLGSYNDCLVKSRGNSKWVAFIDNDEFIVPSEDVSLTQFLSQYEQFAGLGINWRCFGTSYVEKLDEKRPMIEQLVRCSRAEFKVNTHVKSIVKPEFVWAFNGTPHHPEFMPGFFSVHVDKEPRETPFSPVKLDPIRINHYWTKDEYYFHTYKKPRRMLWGDTETSFQEMYEELNHTTDNSILKFVPRLKERMGYQKD